MIMFPFEFISPTEVEVEETNSGVAILKGILLREGVSTNGNLYTIPEMKNISKQAEGMPIYVGTATKYDSNLGVMATNKHANFKPNKVGKILSTIFDSKNRLIRFVAEIVNTKNFPKIIEEVKSGWGISIGGIAHKARLVLDAAGRMLTKILGMKLNHVQLLQPHVKLGQDEARVNEVEIQETMIMYEPIVNKAPQSQILIEADSFYGFEIS
jgi:hypothetical protein